MFKQIFCERGRATQKILGGFFCAGIALLYPPEAKAQTTQPNVTTTTSVNLNLNTPSFMQKLGGDLTRNGIYITALYSGQVAGNPSGGQRQGVAYAARLSFGAAFDMEKIAGIRGGTIHVIFADDTGQSLAAHYVNSDLAQQSLF